MRSLRALSLIWRWRNEITYILQSANAGKDSFLAGCVGWILLNCHPYLVDRRRLLLRNSRGVRAMSNLQVAYVVRLNGKGKGSVEYLTPEEIAKEEESK
jgi:hypothetical protein